jgi:hypothetical protein
VDLFLTLVIVIPSLLLTALGLDAARDLNRK